MTRDLCFEQGLSRITISENLRIKTLKAKRQIVTKPKHTPDFSLRIISGYKIHDLTSVYRQTVSVKFSITKSTVLHMHVLHVHV